MTTPTFTAPPTPPSTSSPSTFAALADAFIAWFATLYAELVIFVAWVVAFGDTLSGATSTTSTSSNSVPASSGTDVTFTVTAGLAFFAGQPVVASRTSDVSKQFNAVVKSYSGTSLVITSTTSQSSAGPYTDWTIGATPGAGKATAAQIQTGSDDLSYVTPKGLFDARAVVAKGNSGTSTQTFVVATSPTQTVTATGNHTWAFTWPSGYSEIAVLATNMGAYTVTLPTVQWLKGDGTKSTTFSDMGVTLQSSGVNTIILWSFDGGTTVYGRAA